MLFFPLTVLRCKRHNSLTAAARRLPTVTRCHAAAVYAAKRGIADGAASLRRRRYRTAAARRRASRAARRRQARAVTAATAAQAAAACLSPAARQTAWQANAGGVAGAWPTKRDGAAWKNYRRKAYTAPTTCGLLPPLRQAPPAVPPCRLAYLLTCYRYLLLKNGSGETQTPAWRWLATCALQRFFSLLCYLRWRHAFWRMGGRNVSIRRRDIATAFRGWRAGGAGRVGWRWALVACFHHGASRWLTAAAGGRRRLRALLALSHLATSLAATCRGNGVGGAWPGGGGSRQLPMRVPVALHRFCFCGDACALNNALSPPAGMGCRGHSLFSLLPAARLSALYLPSGRVRWRTLSYLPFSPAAFALVPNAVWRGVICVAGSAGAIEDDHCLNSVAVVTFVASGWRAWN